jgi:AcrR family transcriptional regulator
MARPQTVSNDQILDAALSCLLEYGSTVSMDVISSRLGVSSQALLKRFHTKRDLVLAALRPPVRSPWHDLVESGPDDRPIEDQLLEITEQMALFFVDITRRMSVLRFSALNPRELMETYDEPPPLADMRLLAAWFDRAAERGMIRRGDHRATAMLLMSGLHTPAMLEDILGYHPVDPDRHANLKGLVELLLSGLRPREPD